MSELSVAPSVQTEALADVVIGGIRITEATQVEVDPLATISMRRLAQKLTWLLEAADRRAGYLRVESDDRLRHADVVRDIAAARALAELLISAF